ncbi:MAG: chromosome partitioning protein ParB [Flavobacteriales bacterium]|nr:chromosome partitioning protein ParB [Flavobacteriales bacterium]
MGKKKQALGRGLDALLSDASTDVTSSIKIDDSNHKAVGNISNIKLSQIEVNPFNPRVEFEKEGLAELAASIKELGLVQPLTVRKLGNDKFQIISGERRFRASQAAGLKEVPAYIRIANDQAMLEMALVENIQRRDLNPLEIAFSYKRLVDECGLTQEELADRVGKKRSSIANYLRLINLPAEIQNALKTKAITFGHARTLIAIDDEDVQSYIFDMIIKEKLSVRKVEELVKETKEAQNDIPTGKTKEAKITPLSFSQQKFRDDLTTLLKSKVKVKIGNNGSGNLVIPFKSEEDFERIMKIIDA